MKCQKGCRELANNNQVEQMPLWMKILIGLLSFVAIVGAINMFTNSRDDQPERERERPPSETKPPENERPPSETERERARPPEEQPAPSERQIQVGRQTEALGLVVTVDEITIEPDRIVVKMKASNQSSNNLSFFPDQGNVVVDDGQQIDADLISTEGTISGEYAPQGEKSGTVVFPVTNGEKLSPQDINKLQFNFGDVSDDETFFEPVQMTVLLE